VTETLTYLPTATGGEPQPDDLVVLDGDLRAGRVVRLQEGTGGPPWAWHLQWPSVDPHGGRCETLEQAKAEHRAAWLKVKPTLDARQLRLLRRLAEAD
jgi:hypothetical protein